MSRISGQFWGDSSGKVAGVVFGRGKGGKSLRARVKPTDAKSLAQQSVRSTFSNSVGTWNAITSQSKRAWNSFAASGFRTKHNKKNSVASGFQAFSSLNFALSLGSSHMQPATFSPTTMACIITDLPTMSLVPPEKSISGCLADADNKPVFVSFIEAIFDAGLSRLTASLKLSPSTYEAPFGFLDPISLERLSLSFYCSKSIPDGQTSTGKSDSYYLGNTGLIAPTTGGFLGDLFEIILNIDSSYSESLKNGFVTGSKVFVSCYLVSEKGQMKRIGVVSTVVSS